MRNPYKFAVPDSEGWYNYGECPSPPDALCQFVWVDAETWIGRGRDLDPHLNIPDLKWRYTGIAKQERGL